MTPGGETARLYRVGRWLVRTEDNGYVIDFERQTVVSYTGNRFETVQEPLIGIVGRPRAGEPWRFWARDRNGAEREVATTSVQDVRRLITQREVDRGVRPFAC